jgi:uncharacterized coiled-coil DUF342 family protein
MKRELSVADVEKKAQDLAKMLERIDHLQDEAKERGKGLRDEIKELKKKIRTLAKEVSTKTEEAVQIGLPGVEGHARDDGENRSKQ